MLCNDVDRVMVALADLGGGVRDARPPLGVQILSISCSFRENLACSRPPGGFTPPPRENPGSATGWECDFLGMRFNTKKNE